MSAERKRKKIKSIQILFLTMQAAIDRTHINISHRCTFCCARGVRNVFVVVVVNGVGSRCWHLLQLIILHDDVVHCLPPQTTFRSVRVYWQINYFQKNNFFAENFCVVSGRGIGNKIVMLRVRRGQAKLLTVSIEFSGHSRHHAHHMVCARRQ